MIEIKHLSKRYGDEVVLSDVNVKIKKGEVISIIGPSGTGKSTFLRCINRLEIPEEGEIRIEGEDVLDGKTNLNKVRRKMGKWRIYPYASYVVSQNPLIILMKEKQTS